MASGPIDPVHALQTAFTLQPNSQEQNDLLARLRESLEAQSGRISLLTPALLHIVVNTGDSLLRRWALDLIHFAICRSTLIIDHKIQMCLKTFDTLVQLVDDPQRATAKVAIQCLTGVYPLLFRYFCSNRGDPSPWTTLTACKTRIIELLWRTDTNIGLRICALKFVQRVVLVHTRGVTDPRLQRQNDPNISSLPLDHPFISLPTLENEGQRLLEGLTHMLFSSNDVDLLCALLNSWVNLAKFRPGLLPFIIGALRTWTTAALAGRPASGVKSVEKAIRILLIHISRLPNTSQYHGQIKETLVHQEARMEVAAAEEVKRKALAAENRKRPPSTAVEALDNKRIKLENGQADAPNPVLAGFDFMSLPSALVTHLIVVNLQAFTEAQLATIVHNFCQARGLNPPSSLASFAPAPGPSTVPQATPASPTKPHANGTALPPVAVTVDAEALDPLKMDIDEDELIFERQVEAAEAEEEVAEIANDVDALNLQLTEFRLPSPADLSEKDKTSLVSGAVTRVWDGAKELQSMGDLILADSSQAGGNTAQELWMLLLVRMITRVAKPPTELSDMPEDSKELAVTDYYARQDELRRLLCDAIMTDFPARVRLATTWMNEEWYNDQLRTELDPSWRPNYEIWLNQIVASYQTMLDRRDKAFARFLLDLPSIPSDVFDLLRDLCEDHASPDRMQVGFTTLRGMVLQRPSMRLDALAVLLDLTTHPEKRVRGAAINTVKIWVPHSQPMDGIIQQFALQILKKLQLEARRTQPAKVEEKATPDPTAATEDPAAMETEATTTTTVPPIDSKVEEEQNELIPEDELVHTPYLPNRIELPAEKSQVLQHVELLFALSVKVPEFLDQLFEAYANMDETVQEAIQDLITALIKSLGSNHGKLLTLLRQCPEGAESLALRVLNIFTDHSRPSSQLVAIVKALVNERGLDARFLVPIIAEMDKADITRYLPHIVKSLNGEAEPKNLVRSVFSSIVATPPQSFGSVSSNLPRVRQSELLTPAELMVLLHQSEKEIGLNRAKEAINICFSMTDVFRSEILAVVMQQIMDAPVLPVLFLRTVIRAVTMYKTLVGFVSTTLLSRLITKKVWMNPPLWEGFILCAKAIAPASFGALLQLPKEQLKELVDKQPSLKSGLRDFVIKKAPSKARGAGFLDILGDPDEHGRDEGL